MQMKEVSIYKQEEEIKYLGILLSWFSLYVASIYEGDAPLGRNCRL